MTVSLNGHYIVIDHQLVAQIDYDIPGTGEAFAILVGGTLTASQLRALAEFLDQHPGGGTPSGA